MSYYPVEQTIPTQPMQTQLGQVQPVQTQPIQTQPVQAKPVQKKPVQKKPVQKEPVHQSGHHSSYVENLPGRVAGFTALREVIRAVPGSGFGSRVVGNTAGIMASDAVREGVNKITHHHHK